MPTSAPGNKPQEPRRRLRSAGFTLIEVVIVLAIVAVAVAAISLALPDRNAAQLEREAERLAALLESARAEARASGVSVSWAPVQDDSGDQFRFLGLPQKIQLPTRWLGEPVAVEIAGGRALLLGPEPMIGPQRLRLRLGDQQLLLETDGLAPFAIHRGAPS
ncbi:GspH/FimT family protein [Pelomonas sp. SE-A7]|uniref:GspH/FimT family protein n=1 Tax=Pelomonas sp. SE-A7 TaxID=3054953 RepID=UPI00259CC1B8|nr:GspH/FimT family protein [Pelomonas sp. SE-A7]MDM4766423.1 GspH/FimT family protein [Pelomonas sp. SE-A7]